MLPFKVVAESRDFADEGARATLARERRSAAAGLLRIRVHENEPLLHQGFVVVERHSMEIDKRLRIYEHPDIAELKDAVTFPRLRIEANVITQTGASSALHSHP